MMYGIDDISEQGARLLGSVSPQNVMEINDDFEAWVEPGSKWLRRKYPNSGLSAKWIGLSSSSLLSGGKYATDAMSFVLFRYSVEARLEWLAGLPKLVRKTYAQVPQPSQEETKEAEKKDLKLDAPSRAFVDPSRIQALQNMTGTNFDTCKLVRMCEELNICHATECYISMIMLMRSIVDHVPPIFEKKNFGEVANNYNGSKSFKKSALKLDQEMRNIADLHLHTHIRKSDCLPNMTQIDFSNSLDLLLGEVVSLLKGQDTVVFAPS